MGAPFGKRRSGPRSVQAGCALAFDLTAEEIVLSESSTPAESAAAITLREIHAGTLREARDDAARWGFVPGPVSIRHNAEAFAPNEPVFRLRGSVGKSLAAERRPVAGVALGLVLVATMLVGHPAGAAQAPREAPLPMARAQDGGMAQSLPKRERASSPGIVSLAPPPGRYRREGPEHAALTTLLSPVPRARAGVAGTAAPAERAAERGGHPGGLAERPDRPARADPAPALPAIGAGAPPPVRAAASERGLPLDRVALVGILNLEAGRKALLRLPDGVFRSVGIGDVIDGWRVSAIGVDAMRVSRGAEDRTLLLVSR